MIGDVPVVLIPGERSAEWGYTGPLPRKDELIELHVPIEGHEDHVFVLFAVTSIRYVANGPYDSDAVRVTRVEVRGRII